MNNMVDKKIDEPLAKKLNETLEMFKPADLIGLLETFVALLRNKKEANHVDVKLYFEDVSKLRFKLTTIVAEKLDLALVEHHEKKLKTMNNKWGGENAEWAVFHEWGTLFCAYATDLLKQKHVQDIMNEVEAHIGTLKSEIKGDTELIHVYENQVLVNYFDDKETKNELLQVLGDRIGQHMNIAVDAQSKYNNFEKRFFRDLNDERQLAKKVGQGLLNLIQQKAKEMNLNVDVKRKSRF